MYKNYETCYEFIMSAEFTTEVVGEENYLRGVNPSEASQLDVNSPFRIQLEFDQPLEITA